MYASRRCSGSQERMVSLRVVNCTERTSILGSARFYEVGFDFKVTSARRYILLSIVIPRYNAPPRDNADLVS